MTELCSLIRWLQLTIMKNIQKKQVFYIIHIILMMFVMFE